jgi:hypothetical protein
MLDGYHSKMSFMRAIPSLEFIYYIFMLQLVFHPPQIASLAFVDIGDNILNQLFIFVEFTSLDRKLY